MTDSLDEAKEALGARLRELRLDAGLSGTELAHRAGWHQTKVSKIEYGKTRPTDADIRTWCAHTRSEGQVADLIATARNIESAYLEWRRVLGTGVKRRQHASLRIESETQFMRVFHPYLIPGLLQTADYAEEVLRRVVEFHRIPDDIEAGVSKRLQRQQVLYRRDHSFHFLIAEQAIRTTVGSDQIMLGQMDRLLAAMGMPRVTIGIIPSMSRYQVPLSNFTLFDNQMVMVENVTAEMTITQPREIAVYGRAFDILTSQSVAGDPARSLIRTLIGERTAG
ncbi:helix-turn-helix transcriptional regulator [Nocardia sp. 2]|uniref:Helix-turn-helix transcriptional regulator n=1 Tax=Nocardia acididurans TaxID=2802282 RepID=A0ABS1M8X5_9NOCA|nr:helix-turn-helix transcriptional regulator [Nocardia acididurans]MBL1077107.1 helix-turn-helix transcriptional regulator [Nocardia acididurans]